MRSSFSLLLISSSLAFPLLMSVSADAADLTLGSRDSYNGDTSTTEFTPKAATSDASGTTYILDGDVSISQAGKQTSLTTSCFSNTAGNLTFLGNGFSLHFDNIISSTVAGVVVSNTAASGITKFSGFSTLRMLAAPRTTGKGAIKITDGLVFESIGNLDLNENASSENGGAINTKTLSLTGSTRFVAFLGNSSSQQGGAIYASGDSVISENAGILSFGNNSATTSGGAISAEGNLVISNNQNIFFDGCKATTNGGAIDCNKAGANPDPILTLSGNESLHFLNNTAGNSGGAIYTKKLVLSSGRGGVLFSNNKAANATPKGGAIAILDSGEISISADLGNIIFEGNTTSTTGSPASVTRNAIDLASNAKFLNLRATRGNKVIFYDPITSSGATDKLSLNKADAGSGNTYEGYIVFSGEKLSEEELKKPDNLKSTFTQAVELAAGALVLKDGVTVVANTITQVEGSKVVMDGGTTFEASAEGVTLNGLAINIDSLDGTNKAIIKATAASKDVALSGPIMLVDAQGNYYEHHNLSQQQVFPLIELSAQGTMTTTDIPDTPILNTTNHYGYQGNWNNCLGRRCNCKNKKCYLNLD